MSFLFCYLQEIDPIDIFLSSQSKGIESILQIPLGYQWEGEGKGAMAAEMTYPIKTDNVT